MKRRCETLKFVQYITIPVLVVCVLGVLESCRDEQTTPVAGDASRDVRLASFSPAMTRIAVDLGLEATIVGRTPWCRSVNPDTPVIGDLTTIDFETLLRVDPTHVLIQPPASGLDPTLLALIEEHDWHVVRGRLDQIQDVMDAAEQIVDAIPPASSHFPGIRQRAQTLVNKLAALRTPVVDPPWRGRVLVVLDSSDGPPLAFGRETYLSTMLSSLGATNVVERTGWVSLSLEDIARLNPDGVILVREGASDAIESNDESVAAGLDRYQSMSTNAAKAGRIALLSDPEVMLPSTGLVDVHASLGAIFEKWGGQSK